MKNYETPTFAKLQEMLDEIYPDPPARQPHHRAPSAANNTRMRRALSWLKRHENSREMTGNLAEEQFLCLWISLNAAYGNDDFIRKSGRPNDQKQFRKLLKNILNFCEDDADSMRRLVCAINMCGKKIIKLAKTPFLYAQFWRAEQGLDQKNPGRYNSWVELSPDDKEHRKKKREIKKRISALSPASMCTAKRKDVHYVLNQTFERLNTLRNQIMHGSSEYEDEYNRRSLAPGIAVLRVCLPEILHIMLTAMKQKRDGDHWGRVAYPPYLNKPDNSENPPKNN